MYHNHDKRFRVRDVGRYDCYDDDDDDNNEDYGQQQKQEQRREQQRRDRNSLHTSRRQQQQQQPPSSSLSSSNRRSSSGGNTPRRQPLSSSLTSSSSSNRRNSYSGGIMKKSSSFSTSSMTASLATTSSSVVSSSSSSSRVSKTNTASSVLSSSSWKARCKNTNEFCAAGHELIQIPTIDRQRYLQRKEQQQQQQQQSYDDEEQPVPIPIIIECDCCSKVISIHDSIAGCCLKCDIDVCAACFKNGQSYIDVILQESRIDDVLDDLYHDEQRHLIIQQQQQQHNAHHQRHFHKRRYNGRRPTYVGTGRVNYDDYPDPTVYQWSFTGSSRGISDEDNDDAIAEEEHKAPFLYPIEYFEKDFGKAIGIIQLDFYYTIGTVQTYLVHYNTGTTDLFTPTTTREGLSAADAYIMGVEDRSQQQKPKRISTDSYRKILKDPRSYNNERYKKDNNSSSSSGSRMDACLSKFVNIAI